MHLAKSVGMLLLRFQHYSMTRILFLLFIGLTHLNSSAQTTLYSNNFTAGSAGFSLGQANNFDTWVVNSIYNCSSTTPNNGGGNYLHIADDLGGDYCAHAGFYGFGGSGTCFATMTTGVSTLGVNQINISFDWLCLGSTSFIPSYGTLEFSVNGGSTWTPITNPINRYSGQSTWTSVNISSANYPTMTNQADLRLRFGWVSSGSGQNPAFAIDNILITGGQPVVCTNVAGVVSATSTSICSGSSATLNLVNAVGTIQWQSSTDGNNWQNIAGAQATSYASAALSSSTYFRALSQQTGCPDAISNVLFIEVLPLSVTQVNLSEVDTVCAGNSISFTANLNNAGNNPTYSWFLNNVLVNQSPTYSLLNPNNGDVVYLSVVPDVACPTTSPVVSNNVTIDIYPENTVTFNLVDTLYTSDSPYQLTGGQPIGGIYSGNGVLNNQFFDLVGLPIGDYTITYSYTDVNGCTNSATQTVTLLQDLSISNSFEKNFPFTYPNPFSNTIHIEGIIGNAQITVYDVIGNILMNRNISNNESFNTQAWSAGLYIYQIKMGNQIFSGKWVKK